MVLQTLIVAENYMMFICCGAWTLPRY